MNDVLILCYHAISDSWETPLAVTPGRFQRQLESLLARGYRGTTFTLATQQRSPGRALAVTFDDAYRSISELAAPILARLGLPATVFAPTDWIGAERPMSWPGIERWVGGMHERELTPMAWAELAELAEQGWEIGSHTCSHPRLPLLDDRSLAAELRASREACESALKRRCTSLAYPYGDHDARVAAAAGASGYVAACGVRPLGDPDDALQRSRVGVYHGDGALRFRLKCIPSVRRLRARRAA